MAAFEESSEMFIVKFSMAEETRLVNRSLRTSDISFFQDFVIKHLRIEKDTVLLLRQG